MLIWGEEGFNKVLTPMLSKWVYCTDFATVLLARLMHTVTVCFRTH